MVSRIICLELIKKNSLSFVLFELIKLGVAVIIPTRCLDPGEVLRRVLTARWLTQPQRTTPHTATQVNNSFTA